jgi:hypothetical protein
MRKHTELFLFSCALILLTLGNVDNVGAQAQTSAPPVPRGIMTFGGGKILLEVKTLDLPYISGVTAFFKWSDLEREDGVYDFRDIDELIRMAKPKGKIVNLMFSSGMHAPEWLFQKGVKTSSWTTYWKENKWAEMGESSTLKTPLPWDPIYLDYWKRFITKIAEKYGPEPTVGYVSITGPVQRGLTTTIAAKRKADLNQLAASGYSEEKMSNAWIDMIEHYEKVLGNKRLLLALAVDVRGKPAIHRAQDLVRYVEKRKYTNISFMLVFLNDTWFKTSNTTRRLRDLLKDAKADGYTFGYQMGQSAERGAKWKRSASIVKSLRDSLAIGIDDGASWIEVWHPDIVDSEGKNTGAPNMRYAEDLKWAHDALLGKAPK